MREPSHRARKLLVHRYSNERMLYDSLNLDYYSNWTELIVSFWAVCQAYIARSNEKPTKLLSNGSTVATVLAYTDALTVFIAFWTGQSSDVQDVGLHSIYQHAVLAAIVLLDAVITTTSFR